MIQDKVYKVRLDNGRVFAARFDGYDRRGRLRFIASNGMTSWHCEDELVSAAEIIAE
jgi:hypothetical protein